MSKPSVLLINRVYPPDRGATGRLMEDLSAALEKNGWKVTILTTGQKAGPEYHGNITIERIKGSTNYKTFLGYALSWFRLLFAALKQSRHDIVITLTDPPLVVFIGRMVARFKKAKHVHWCQDMYPDLFKILGVKFPAFFDALLHRMARRSMNKCSKVVVVGQCMGKRLTATGVQASKVTMIANWADLEVVAPSSTGDKYDFSNTEVAARARKPEEMFRDDSPKFRVLYAGNIGRAHPMRSVIEAADILSEHAEIEFVFVGDKHVHSILARERGKRALENIKFMPYQPIDRLHDVMESGDVHLVTMRNDTRGMLVPCKFYSGLTVGRPTVFVGPEDCEIGHVIKNYNAGKIVPVGDAQALADAIYSYRMDGDGWFQAQEGALRAAQAYHPNQSLHKWVDLLEQVRISG